VFKRSTLRENDLQKLIPIIISDFASLFPVSTLGEARPTAMRLCCLFNAESSDTTIYGPTNCNLFMVLARGRPGNSRETIIDGEGEESILFGSGVLGAYVLTSSSDRCFYTLAVELCVTY